MMSVVHRLVRHRTLAEKDVLIRAEERLLAAAKTDNEEMLETAMQELDDINCVDGCVQMSRPPGYTDIGLFLRPVWETLVSYLLTDHGSS